MTTKNERWLPHVSVAAIIEKDKKFLLVEERKEGRLMLNQPAGHWENNETLVEAVIRETLEETAWHFRPNYLVGIYQWQHPKDKELTYLRFAFGGELLSKDHTRHLDDGIENTVWYDKKEILDSVDRHRSPQLVKCVEDYINGNRYSLDCIHLVP